MRSTLSFVTLVLFGSLWIEIPLGETVFFSRFSFLQALLISMRIVELIFAVVIQQYEAEADNEYVIRGNSAIMKCEIPSYVSDFIVVDMWADSDGGTYYPNTDQYGIHVQYADAISVACHNSVVDHLLMHRIVLLI